MEERFIGRINFERATGYFAYSRGSKFANLVHDFKYRKYPSLAAVFGELIGRELLTGGFFADSDLIVPIPVHFMKRMRRGYNQSEFFARGLSTSTGIKISYCLGARRNHKTQTGKTLEERTSNVSGIFRVQRPELLKGKHLVIADDVCTTGSTLCEAVRTIDEATAHTCRFTLLTIGVTV